jgi:hypothetical protein
MAHARAMKILVPTLRFVARAFRRAASTVVSTFFSDVTAIRLEVQREINALPLFSTERSKLTHWAELSTNHGGSSDLLGYRRVLNF